jgi:hypothetical protein
LSNAVFNLNMPTRALFESCTHSLNTMRVPKAWQTVPLAPHQLL